MWPAPDGPPCATIAELVIDARPWSVACSRYVAVATGTEVGPPSLALGNCEGSSTERPAEVMVVTGLVIFDVKWEEGVVVTIG